MHALIEIRVFGYKSCTYNVTFKSLFKKNLNTIYMVYTTNHDS